MADLAELLVLMDGARNRFRTVRAEVVERTHGERCGPAGWNRGSTASRSP